MAEAFGRALQDPGASRKGKELVEKAITIDDGMPDLSGRLDRDVAYTKGRRDANAENLDDLGKPRAKQQAAFDKRTEQRTDERLAKTEVDQINSELWNRAFMAANKDLQSKQLWHMISDLRNKGIAEADILNVLRTMGK